jgi:flagellar biosynthesis protein FliQ
MEARAGTLGGDRAWRLWALGPVLLLALVVGLFVSSGSSLVDLSSAQARSACA